MAVVNKVNSVRITYAQGEPYFYYGNKGYCSLTEKLYDIPDMLYTWNIMEYDLDVLSSRPLTKYEALKYAYVVNKIVTA